MSMLLVCALVAASAPIASARTITPEKIHARVVKQGMGNWVGVELANGTAFWGRIITIDDQSVACSCTTILPSRPYFTAT
jgi:hypothetical protein